MIAPLALMIVLTAAPPEGCVPLGTVHARTYIRREANAAAATVTAELLRDAARLGATAITPPAVRPWTYFADSPHRLTVQATTTAFRCSNTPAVAQED